MVDNVAITPGTGTTIAADDIGAGVLAQRIKPVWGPDGTGNDTDIASGKALPIQVRSATGLVPIGEPTDAKSTATDTTSVSAISVWKQISASVQSLFAGAATLETGRNPVNTIPGQAGVAAGAGAVGATTQRTTLASDDPAVASLASLVTKKGYAARVQVTRPSDTTAYAAGDVVGVTGGGTACITFANMGPGAGEIVITSARFQRNATAVISGETSYTLHLYSVTQPAGQIDNAVFDVAAGDQASYLGSISLGVPVDLGSTLAIEQNGVNKQVTLAGTSLFGVLVTVGGYTPVSAAVHVVELHSVAV